MNSSFVIILLSFAILIAYVVYSLVTLKVMPERIGKIISDNNVHLCCHAFTHMA